MQVGLGHGALAEFSRGVKTVLFSLLWLHTADVEIMV